jgi:hypothetical protein
MNVLLEHHDIDRKILVNSVEEGEQTIFKERTNITEVSE